jgi:hypothetical protein
MASRESAEKPLWFDYYVFGSRDSEPTDQERDAGVYLVGEAEARHLQQFFEPLYRSAGIAIHTSDDEVISGAAKLTALRKAVDAAIRDVEDRPPDWPVEIGVSMESLSGQFREPIFGSASRFRLLEFLRDVATRVDDAVRSNSHIHFGGGR